MSDKTPNLDSLFEAALQIESADERAVFLDQSCGNNQELRNQVERLLQSDEQAGSFLNKAAVEAEATSIGQSHGDLAASIEAGFVQTFGTNEAVVLGDPGHSVLKSLGLTVDNVPRVVLRESAEERADPILRPASPEMPQNDSDSRYRLDGEIARGGMGAILKGRDVDLGRELAIKVLLDQHKDKPEVIQRFVEEAQIGGQLQHPGIAPVYELGQFSDKRPFFSMKLVKGETLSKLLMDRRTPADDRAKFIGIFEQVCQTMAYAHSRGVIHRDLKPANIMVGAFGEVQVMDWGLAKVLSTGGVEDEVQAHSQHKDVSIIQTMRSQVGSDTPGMIGSVGSHTQMGSVMGTPAYMPPEQALGEIDNMDERADVFGLGAILCEILTGKPPYVADDGTRVYRMASRGKLDNCFQRLESCGADEDLLALTKHCLELEPADRPRNAGVLAERVTEYLESVETRLREAEVERAAHAARADAEAAQAAAERKRAEAESQRAEAESQRAEAQAAKAQAESARANEERKRRRTSLALAASVLLMVGLGSGGWLYMERQEANRQTAEADAQRQHAADMRALADERDDQRKVAELARTVAESARQQADTEKRNSLNMLADMQTERGLLAAREGQSATAALWFANAATLTPHDFDRRRANHLRASSWLNEAIVPVALLKLPDGNTRRFEFQPHGSLALTVSGRKVRVWDWRNEVVLPWSETLVDVTDADWSPDGRQLAVSFGNGEVRLCEPSSGTELKRFQHPERVEVLQWSPDGTRLAVAGRRVQIWSVAAEPVSESDWPHPETIFGLRFNRAGTRLATSCNDEFARVFAVDDASLPAPLFAPVDHVPNRKSSQGSALFFDEDRKLATVARSSRRPVLRDAATGEPVTTRWTSNDPTAGAGFSVSPDGRWVATAGFQSAFLLSADGRSVELKHMNHVRSVSFHPDGRSLVTTCWDGTARWWPLRNLKSESPSIGSPLTIPQMATISTCAISLDGASLAISTGQQVVIWERTQSQLVVGQIAWTEGALSARPSFDGQFVAPGIWHVGPFSLTPGGGTLRVARVVDGQPAGPPITLDGLLWDSCVCADNRSVAAATVDGATGMLTVYDIASGAPVVPSIELPDVPLSVAARPGNPQVAVLCKNGSLLVIDTQRGKSSFDLHHDGATGLSRHARVVYSPDGATLLTVTPNHLVFVRDAQTGELRFPPLRPVLEGGPCRAIAFSPDSRLLATAVNGRNMVQVWDLATGEKIGREMPHPGDYYGLFSVTFSPDGQLILTGHKDGRARLWDWMAGTVVGTPMKHPDEVYDAQFTPDGRHVVTAVRHASPHVWDLATGKLAVPFPQIVPEGSSSDTLAIAGDRLVVTSGKQYSVLDLSLLLRKPTDELPMLLTRAELTTNQKLQLGEPVPLERQEWSSRWDELVAARQTPEEAVRSLASEFDEAQSESARRAVAMRAMQSHLAERLQQLRPDDPHLQIALAAEFSRAGRQAELKRIRPKAIAAVQKALRATPTDDALQRGLARLLVDELPSPRWSQLEPSSMTAESNGTFTRQPDGSLFVEGTPAATDQYTITSHSPLRRITALKLDVIPDARLPRGGSGLDVAGNFQLTELRARVRRKDGSTISLSFRTASSDYIRPIDQDTTLADGPWGVIDDDRSTQWDVWTNVSKPHWLTLQLREAIDLASDDELMIELEFKGRYHNGRMGRFKLSVGNDEHAAETMLFSAAIRNELFAPRESLAAISLMRGDAAKAIEYLADSEVGGSATGSESGPETRTPPTSTVTWLLRALALQRLGATDAAKATVEEMLAGAPRTVPRDLNGLFLDVVTEIGGRARGESQALLAKWEISPELKRLTREIEADPTDATLLSKRAAAYLVSEQWELAKADWTRIVEIQPDQVRSAFDVFRMAEQWNSAADFGLKVLEQTPENSSLWIQVAVVMALSSDEADYIAFCNWIVDQPAGTVILADRSIKVCLLKPRVVDIAALPTDVLARELDEGTAPDWINPYAWACRALLAYRNAEPELAVKFVAQSETHEPIETVRALNQAVLAMAQQELQHPDEARTALAEASRLITLLQAKRVNQGNPDLLIAEILFREAAAKINGSDEPTKAEKEE